MTTQAKLAVEAVTHVYESGGRSTLALESISLTVRDQEFLAMVGPSGCGKTTLLRIVAGLLVPSSGIVRVDGRDVTGRTSPDRGVVFQADAVFPWMTVQENVMFGPTVRRMPRDEARATARRFIELVGLAGSEASYPKELSGGMRKRVDLARTYANQPAVMLMDEPFGSLDAYTKGVMQTELLRIWDQERRTVLFVTHDLEEALYLSDRVIVLSARPGRVQQAIEVPLGRPRLPSAKTQSEFVRLRAELSEMLH
jgi:NitT/TauT family transport system ATP-binding protein